MNLFQLGDHVLSSGARSRYMIDCDALTDADIACLAEMVRHLVGPFSAVEGVPRGGLRLAEALRPHRSHMPDDEVVLVVDDVLTTGASMERARDAQVRAGLHWSKVKGAVIFARGKCPYWAKAVFPMPECFWPKED